MNCDCSIDVDCYPEFSTTKVVTARKLHKCCECDEQIKPGEKYELVQGKWEGQMDKFNTCIPCSNIRNDYCPNGYEFGGLSEAIWECLGFNYVTGEMNENFR